MRNVTCVLAAVTVLALFADDLCAQPVVDFAEATAVTVGESPQCVAHGDLDRDGQADLVVANWASGSISVLLGNGDGTFRSRQDTPTGAGPYSVALGDVDHDGQLDAAVPNSGSNTVSVLLGNGDGTFRTAPEIPLGEWPSAVCIADMNRDSNLDLVLSVGGLSTVTNAITVLLGNGDGSFGTRADFDAYCPSIPAVGDLNDDGNLDVAVPLIFNYCVAVFLGDGRGGLGTPTYYPVGINPDQVVIADLSGDDRADVAATNSQSQSVSVFLGNGDGTLGARTDFATGPGPLGLAVADLNRDGVPDLAVATIYDQAVSVLVGIGDGTFGPYASFPIVHESTSRNITAADLNGDGAPELMVTGEGTNTCSLLLNTTPAPNRPPALTLPAACAVSEGDTLRFTAMATDPDQPPQTLTFALLSPSPAEASLDVATGAVQWLATDDASVVFRVQVSDGEGGVSSGDVPVEVANVAPAPAILQPVSGAIFPTGATVALAGSFGDPGPNDTHTAVWGFDASSIAGVVDEASHSVSGGYVLAAPGVYLVSLMVRDDDQGEGITSTVDGGPAMVVAYDPNAGFVSGNGWFASPPGALASDPLATGKTRLAFVSKYTGGSVVPTGQVRIKFPDGNLDFVSSSQAWLVVGGGRAKVAGVGDLNGTGGHSFEIAALDGDLASPATADRIRVRIWTTATNQSAYDTQPGAPADAVPETELGAGSVVVHAGSNYRGDIDPFRVEPQASVPARFAFRAITPNPFVGGTRIAFDLPVASRVCITIHDPGGRRVANVLDAALPAGTRSIAWPDDEKASALNAGIYFVRLRAHGLDGGGEFEAVRRVVRLR